MENADTSDNAIEESDEGANRAPKDSWNEVEKSIKF